MLNLFGISFDYNQIDESLEYVDTGLTTSDIIVSTHSLLETMDQINERGYVQMSIFENDNHFLNKIASFLNDMGYEKPTLGGSKTSYTLWHNFLFINFYRLLQERLKHGSGGSLSSDIILELEGLSGKILAKIDPFLRFQLQKRGITIMQHSYVGFDTEFEMEDHTKFMNRLISVQFAVQCRTLVKVPLYSIQDISYVHPLTNEISAFYKPKDDN